MAIFPSKIQGYRVGNFLAGAAAASVIGGSALAITSTTFTYSASQRGYYTINPMAMAPRGNAAADNYLIVYPTELSGQGCYQTGVNLPQGATIERVVTWYRRGVYSSPAIYFYRQNLSTNASNVLVFGPSNNSTTTARQLTSDSVPAALRMVDNLTFSYAYAFCANSSGDRFSGARINYIYNSAGD